MGRSVVVVDDHPGFLKWARAFLESEGYVVIGEAVDGSGALETVRRLRPDVVLLDVHIPGVDGIEVSRRIAGEPNPPVVVLISSRDPQDFGHRLETSPALGFVSKVDLTGRRLTELLGAT